MSKANEIDINDLSTTKLPYVYQSDYYSIAWGKQHRGFYILPNGDKYVYEQPTEWKFHTVQPYEEHPATDNVWGFEDNGEVSPENLFLNIKRCTKAFSFRSLFGGISLSSEAISSLLKSTVTGRLGYKTDQGTLSNSILIFYAKTNCYKRVLLSATGQMELRNSCKYASKLISRGGTQFPLRR
jgi:hypothetical protein